VKDLRLRPLRIADEAPFHAAHDAMAAEGFSFGFGLDEDLDWQAYIASIEDRRRGIGVRDGFVPATFLVAVVENVIVGRTSIRHELNDFLRQEGGHIGYCVLPELRRRGYATEILRQSLVLVRAVGVDDVLLTCDDVNVGSAAVIERCGGELESVVAAEDDGRALRRYWIR
jgi:predicted acetyltransferase